jgi:hypothetical protein
MHWQVHFILVPAEEVRGTPDMTYSKAFERTWWRRPQRLTDFDSLIDGLLPKDFTSTDGNLILWGDGHRNCIGASLDDDHNLIEICGRIYARDISDDFIIGVHQLAGVLDAVILTNKTGSSHADLNELRLAVRHSKTD